jgi:Flp pilus assembly protein CpaB
MKAKTGILMLVAIGCGLAAAFLAALYQHRQQQVVLVLVAAQDLRVGMAISEPEHMLMARPYLADSVPAGAVQNIEDLRGKILARSIDKNTPVTLKDINFNEDLLSIAPPGTRAVTIKVNAETAHPGFTLPGSHVDLVCTVSDPADPRRMLTKTFVQHVLVLAVNAQQQLPTQGPAIIPNPATVTLAVDPDDAERVLWARDRGTITLTLRKRNDDKLVKTKGAVNPFAQENEMIRVFMAKKDILPGDTIDDVDSYFEVAQLPQGAIPSAIPERDRARLRHQVVRAPVLAGSPLMERHLNLQARDEEITWLTIQTGDKPPRHYKYINNRSPGWLPEEPVKRGSEKAGPEKG